VKRVFFITLLMLSSGPTYAQWEAVGDNVDLDTIYIDIETLRRKGELAEVWVMTDSKLAKRFLDTNSFYLSVRQLQQFNCGEEHSRILNATWFSSNMGKGTVIDTLTKEGQWNPLPPGSVGRRLMEVICKK
jgi:hypothetical protein